MRELARLLSRAAALQGQAAPVSRFEFQSITDSDSLDLIHLIEKLWLNVFPKGSVTALPQKPNNDQLPAIWVPQASESANPRAVLIRGITATKAIAEDASGDTFNVPLAELSQGKLLLLRMLKNQIR